MAPSKRRADLLGQGEKCLRLAWTADPRMAEALRAMAMEHQAELERLYSNVGRDESEAGAPC
jgi:hypothetical protein